MSVHVKCATSMEPTNDRMLHNPRVVRDWSPCLSPLPGRALLESLLQAPLPGCPCAGHAPVQVKLHVQTENLSARAFYQARVVPLLRAVRP